MVAHQSSPHYYCILIENYRRKRNQCNYITCRYIIFRRGYSCKYTSMNINSFALVKVNIASCA